MRRLLVPLLVGLASVACSGSRRAADADWTPEPEHVHRPLRETETLGASMPVDEPAKSAVLGVRHDLMLSPTPHEARCACLSVEVGRADDARFFWAGGAPDVGADALALAIGARGIACPGGDPDYCRRRPSISGVYQDGDDIEVEVEDLPDGRPLASGAIIPRPGPKGSIYVRPKKGNAIYGRNPGVARCRIR